MPPARRFGSLAAATLVGVALLAVLAIGLPAARIPGGSVPVAQAQGSAAVFSVEATTFESHYPRGMTFTIKATSTGGDIARATLFLTMRPGTRERANGDYDAATGLWTAGPYTDGGGIPPWIEFSASWLLTDAAGNTFETEPEIVTYADHTREWQHVETDEISLYWFGFSEDGEFGEMVRESMNRMHTLFAEGWGGNLDYKPIVVFFPDGNVWDEFTAGGNNPGAAGFTNNGWGYSVQRLAGETPPDFLLECVQRWGYSMQRSLEWRLQRGVTTIVHELTHVYQSAYRVGGASWWVEGQADYFAGLTGLDSPPDERLTNLLSVTNDLPTIQGEGPSLALSVMAADSCNGLGYDIGNDFIGWLLDNYGGLETHHAIVLAMKTRDGLDVALERVTGVPFLELENQWRASWGLEPVQVLPTATPFVFPTAPVFSLPTSPASSGGG